MFTKKNAKGEEVPVSLEEVLAEVGKVTDAKISAGFDTFRKTGLADVIKVHMDPLTTQLSAITESLGKILDGGHPAPDQKPNDGKPAPSPEINAQIRQLTDLVKTQGNKLTELQTAKELAEKRAEETERHSKIRSSLNGLPFVNEKAADTAFSIVLPHVRRLDDGGLVAGIGGDNFPVDSFTRDYLEKEHGYLFKSTGSTGSGAPANPGGTRMGVKADINSIKVGMSSEDRMKAVQAIAEAVESNAA